MPGRGRFRKLGLPLASFTVLMVAVFIPGCGTAPASDSPVTDLSLDTDNNVLYIGAKTLLTTVKGGGGFCINELDKNRFKTKNETNGFWGPNVCSVQYDSVTQQVFILHSSRRETGSLSLYDRQADSMHDTGILAEKMTLAEDKLFHSSSGRILMSNRTGAQISSSSEQIYSSGTNSSTAKITAMLWENDSLYFSMSSMPYLMCWKDGTLRIITGPKCNCMVKGPLNRIYLGTDAGLQYYDISSGQVFNTTCSGQVIDIVTNWRDNLIYALVTDSSECSIKAHQPIGDSTTVIVDESKCHILAYRPTCLEFSVKKNYLYAGTGRGMMVYNILSKNISTKTYKNGMPTEPSHNVAPGFEIMAAVTVVVAVAMIRKYRKECSG